MYIQLLKFLNGTDPFDCSDYCHLAWFIRDQPNLLARFPDSSKPTCSNGTAFSDLNSEEFADCLWNSEKEGYF